MNSMNIVEVRKLSPHFSSSSGRVYHWLARHKIGREGKFGKYRYDATAIQKAMAADPPNARETKRRKSKPPKKSWVLPATVARFLGIKKNSVSAFAERHKDALRRKSVKSARGTKRWLYCSADLTPELKALVHGGKAAPRNLAGQVVSVKEKARETRAIAASNGNGQPSQSAWTKAMQRTIDRDNADLVLGVRHLLETRRAGFLRQETFMEELEYLVNVKHKLQEGA